MILASSQERVRLLKAGISGSDIEKIYVTLNDYKIVNSVLPLTSAQRQE